jgi:hypothetical protein
MEGRVKSDYGTCPLINSSLTLSTPAAPAFAEKDPAAVPQEAKTQEERAGVRGGGKVVRY